MAKRSYIQILGDHSWTKTMENLGVVCGECPECMTPAEPEHTEFSGGDGERGYVEYDCKACGASWTDSYNLVTRNVYPAQVKFETKGEPVETHEFREGVTYRMTNGIIHEVAV